MKDKEPFDIEGLRDGRTPPTLLTILKDGPSGQNSILVRKEVIAKEPALRSHRVNEVAGFCAYLVREQKPADATVFMSLTDGCFRAAAVLDDLKPRANPREVIRCEPILDRSFKAWTNAAGSALPAKEFVGLLRTTANAWQATAPELRYFLREPRAFTVDLSYHVSETQGLFIEILASGVEDALEAEAMQIATEIQMGLGSSWKVCWGMPNETEVALQ